MDFPLKNTRKLWKYMFQENVENQRAIETLDLWLRNVVADTERRLKELSAIVPIPGTRAVIKKAQSRHKKIKKLQAIFYEMAEEWRIWYVSRHSD